MKKTLYIIPLLIGLVILLASFGDDTNTDYPSGAPAGYTGSPADGQDCQDCHGGTSTPTTGVMTSNVPSTGYVPGTSYTITVTLTGTTGKGFEVSPQDLSGNLLGTLAAGSNNHITGTKYVTHNAKITTTPAVWNFTWTAPAVGTGPVTFYGAFTLSKPVTKTSTMVIPENVTVPPVTATATANPSTIVQGGSSQLNVTASGGTGSYTYSWTSNPPGFTSTQQNPTVTPGVTTTYTCSVTSGTQNTTANTTVTVLEPLSASAGADPSTIIEGESSQLSVSASGGTGSYTYSWTSNPAGFTSGQQNPVVNPSVTTQYMCAVTSGTQNTTANTTVTVIPLLSATASANPPSILPGESSQLSAVPAGGTGSYTYLWSSNPPGFTSTSQNPTVTPTETTQYTVDITSGSQITTATTSVLVGAGLQAVASANPPTILQGETSQLDVYTSGGSGSETYSWTSDPPGFTSAEKSPVVAPMVTTIYTCTVTSGSQTASSSATVTVSTINGIDKGKSVNIRLWPNPATDVINIEGYQDAAATIYNLNGIQVRKDIFIRSGSNSIDLSGIPAGVYILQVRSENGNGVYRFVKR